MNQDHFEIERKFLIRYPDTKVLAGMGEWSEIEQTYLKETGDGFSARVRKRGRDGQYTYTHTVKQHITDIRRVEIEREIDAAEYAELLKKADPKRQTIYKTRWVIPYAGKCFEIDLFPFWTDRAFMEIELSDENEAVDFPSVIEIIREVTDDKRYTNSALSMEIPYDVI